MNIKEAILCPECLARSAGRFGILPDAETPGEVNVVVKARFAWPDRGKVGVYHVRLRESLAVSPANVRKLLCRIDAPELVEWGAPVLDPRVQHLLGMVADASHGWGDDLYSVDEETPIVELDDGARRCVELAIEAVAHFARGDWRRAVAQSANGAQLELLILCQRLGYDALWREFLTLAETGEVRREA